MPSSAESAREEIARTIVALERSCLDADAALVEKRWPDVDAAFKAQAALTEQLARLFDAVPDAAPANDAKVDQRVRGILAYRADQMRRLQTYQAEIAARLENIGKVNAFSRSIGRRGPAAQLLDLQY
jgi:GAF domain-containing protein